MRGTDCDAYLLSESSLLVHDDYLTIITCGRTRLIESVFTLLDHIGPDDVRYLIYQRKNEHFPERQRTTFYEDARRLRGAHPRSSRPARRRARPLRADVPYDAPPPAGPGGT